MRVRLLDMLNADSKEKDLSKLYPHPELIESEVEYSSQEDYL